ncbi:MFS transporter [Blastococcus sp. TML/M2B]|uniref:MFS transporter n=1 Tax=unclassified Blastococcus TaxID=2619396 RepID=UPI00190BB01E|nr:MULTISPECIES: MFS transporter [unclassified Blastococcus]MBN1094148.1 MFS transporter [Blastococcus sp. TML/M2B]MBN1095732.1 MFS transporter [Blastococcus sp. TML/C7B]
MSDVAPPRPRAGSAATVALVLGLSLVVTVLSLLQSLVVPVLDRIGEQLDVSPGAAGWVLTANLLAAAVLTPVLGRLGDLRGERPVIIGILVTVAAGTVLAIATESLPLLLLARVLQGASYGLFPLSISVLRRELPERRLGTAMSVVSSTLGVGGVAGLVATGLLAGDGTDYRRPFWIGLVITLAALVLAVRLLPRRTATASGGVDWWGAAVLGAGLSLLLLFVSQGNAWGWSSAATLGCLAGSVVVLSGWAVLQRRLAEPLVRPAMLADRRTIVPNVVGMLTGVAMFASFLAVLQYVQSPTAVTGYGFDASVLEATVVYLLPGGIVGVLLAPFAGSVVTRFGGLPTLVVGWTVGLAGFVLLTWFRSQSWAVIAAGLLTQVAVTVAYAALPSLVVQAVHEDETGVANAINSIARSVGQALGSALAVTIIAAHLDAATGLPRDVAFTLVGAIGMGAAVAILVAALLGLRADRRAARPRRPDPLAAVEEATAGAGEWSPVSGLR